MRQSTPISHTIRRGVFYAARTPARVHDAHVARRNRVRRPVKTEKRIVSTATQGTLPAVMQPPAAKPRVAPFRLATIITQQQASEYPSLRETWKQKARIRDNFLSGLRSAAENNQS